MIRCFQRDGRLGTGFLLMMIASLMIIAISSLATGRYNITFQESLISLWHIVSGQETDRMAYTVLLNLRLPRVLLALIIGAGLACAGASFQSLFANPLATQDTLGVTSGASVGAVLALLTDANMLVVQIFALIFGLLTVGITVSVARIRGRSSIVMLVLAGVIISAIFNAILTILKYTADPINKLPDITYWLMGSLSGTNYRTLLFGIPFISVGIITILAMRWRLNILTLSEDEARTAGVNVQYIRIAVITASTMITASCISMCGQVGWVGLLVPHCARMICGSNNQVVIPVSIFLGGMFLIIIDTMARTLIASEIPISVLTAIIGAPFFILLLRRTGGNWT